MKLRTLIPDRSPVRLAWHHGKAYAAALRYGFPAKHLTVIGITGTDGKTTTTGMLAHILHVNSKTVGAASTAFMQINNQRTENATHLTSVSPFSLQSFLRSLVDKHIEFAVIEMSSHGLVQGRVYYTYPLVAGITNTALEHLDYHKTMEQYRRDKGILFQMLNGKGTKVLNEADESYIIYQMIPTDNTITFGTANSNFCIENIVSEPASVSAVLREKNGRLHNLTLPIPGTFNVQNAMCAIGCANALGISTDNAVHALKSFNGIPGRMERIDEGQNFSVFVDFSVSPQSYEQALTTLRKMVAPGKRVMVLCSSCGNRMEAKRPEIGKVCSNLADVVVATEDETYGEDPHKVLDEVWAGIDQSACDAHKIFDRREAIRFLIEHAEEGDAIVLCGMGPFSTMNKLEGQMPWDEREVAREEVKRRVG